MARRLPVDRGDVFDLFSEDHPKRVRGTEPPWEDFTPLTPLPLYIGFTGQETLNEVRARVLANTTHKGNMCPCCDQNAETRNRPVGVGQAKFLIALVHYDIISRVKGSGVWLRFGRVWDANDSRDYPNIQYFEMAFSPTKFDSASRGAWTPTKIGHEVVINDMPYPAQCWVYNNQVVGFAKEMRTLRGVCRSAFSSAIWNWIGNPEWDPVEGCIRKRVPGLWK